MGARTPDFEDAEGIRLRKVFDAVQDGILLIDADTGRILDFNRFLEQLTGYSRSEIMGKTLVELGIFKDFAALKSLKALQTQDTARFDALPLQKKSGQTLEVEFLCSAYPEAGKRIMECTIRDITARRSAERTLSETEKKYYTAFRNSPFALLITEVPSGRIIEANTIFFKTTGFSQEETLGKTTVELNVWGSNVDRDRYLQELQRTGHVADMQALFRKRSGELFPCALYGELLQLPEGNCVLTVVQDVTELKKAQEALRLKNLAFDVAITANSIADARGLIVEANPQFLRTWGYNSLTELIGKPIASFIRDKGVAQAILAQLNAAGGWSGEFVAARKDGSLFTANGFATVVRDSAGTLIGYQASVLDVTDRARTQQELEASYSLLSAALESTADGLLIVDGQGNITRFNNRFAQMWRLPSEVLASKDEDETLAFVLGQLVAPEQFINKIKELYAHPDEESFDVLDFKDGRIFERFSMPQRLGDRIVGRVWSFRDATHRKRMEQALQQSEFFFKESQRAASIGSYQADFIKDTWTSSEVLDQIFGIGKSYVRSVEGWLDLIHPDDRAPMASYLQQEVAAKRKPFNKEYRIVRKSDGKVRFVLGLGEAGFDGSGTMVSLIGTIQDITDRKLAELRLLESEAALNEAQRIAHIGSWQLDIASGVLHWSAEIYDIFGLDKDRFSATYEAFLGAIHPDDREKVRDAYERSVKDRLPYAIDHRILLPDGTIKHVTERCATEYDAQGHPVRSIGTVQDITDRKHAEAEILEKESRYQTLFDNANDAIFLMEGNVFIDCNRKTLQMFRYAKERIVGQPPYLLSPDMQPDGEKSKDAAEKRVIDAYAGKPQFFEWRHLRSDGTTFDTEVSLNRIELHGHAYILAIVRDISERKIAEQRMQAMNVELRRANEVTNKKYWDLAENINQGMFTSRDGRFSNTNRAMAEMFGYSREAMNGMEAELLVLPAQRKALREKFRVRSETNDHSAIEVDCVRKDGSRIAIEVRISGLIDNELYGLITDITDRKKAEREIRKMNKQLSAANSHLKDIDKTKTEFLNMVSHELKTPLTAMMAYMDVIDSATVRRMPKDRRALSAIRRNAEQLRDLITNILEISRIQSGRVQLALAEVDLNKLIKRSIKGLGILAKQKRIALKTVLHPLPLIEADESRMKQILNNLLTNAIKFTDKGSITVKTGHTHNQVMVSVKDTGIGIPKDKMKNLFKDFYQVDASLSRKYGGTGIGLYITKNMVDAHGGTMTVSSAPGKGSTFTFSMPIRAQHENRHNTDKPLPHNHNQGAKLQRRTTRRKNKRTRGKP